MTFPTSGAMTNPVSSVITAVPAAPYTITAGLSVLSAGGHVVVPSPYALRPPAVVQGYNNYWFGMTSYGGIAGTISTFYTVATKDGIFYVNSQTRMADIVDGTSSTLAIGEAAGDVQLTGQAE